MNLILIKIFATALALSQITTRPDDVKQAFDATADRAEVAQLLRNGCTHLKGFFDIEQINMDDLIATAMKDPQGVPDEIRSIRGIDIDELHVAYREFCKNETVEKSPVDIGEVIAFYNNAARDLPDPAPLMTPKLPGATTILDTSGKSFAEIFEPNNRRVAIPLADVPEHVQQAFISAEDKRFREHRGVDERGVIRAFIGLMTQPGRPPGGSTITQQVVKNLLVGNDVTYERKIRELLLASKVEKSVSKRQILELYLNSIYLGRGAWGIELAAQAYFNKPAKELTLFEGAFLAGLPKGPAYYNPDRFPERAKERLAYVLGRMQADGVITTQQMNAGLQKPPQLVKYERPQRDGGYHFVEYVNREAKGVAKLDSLTADSYVVRSTVLPQLQRDTETALQDGLARYEQTSRRAVFQGPETNLAEAIKKIEGDGRNSDKYPAWQQALERAVLPLYDVHWPAAVIVEKGAGGGKKKNEQSAKVGLRDGRVLPLAGAMSAILAKLSVGDVIYVSVNEGNAKTPPRAEMRIRPTVQGSAIVLENKTGRILAMAGAFSFPLSQLNRATQTRRQPGSALKPLTYLTALAGQLQPNTLVYDEPVTFPPIGNSIYATQKDYWSPKNYDGRYGGLMTLRRGLENSKNLITARLLDGGIANTPQQSLDQICALAVEAQIYPQCERYYPFILGAQPVRLVDLAAFYAAIANEGERPSPHAIESIERGGQKVFSFDEKTRRIELADRVAFYQLKTMLQGVVARGTAASISRLSPFVAGKTGTSEEENDAWFVGFTNDVTIAVWVGYDNADGKRRTLGGGRTGGNTALPIFEQIVRAAWLRHAPQARLSPPSPEARKQLVAVQIDLNSGERLYEGVQGGFTEYFRADRTGRLAATQQTLIGNNSYDNFDDSLDGDPRQRTFFGYPFFQSQRGGQYMPRGEYQWEYGVGVRPRVAPRVQQEPPITEYDRPRLYERQPSGQYGQYGGQYGPRPPADLDRSRLLPRVDPDYFWTYRRNQ